MKEKLTANQKYEKKRLEEEGLVKRTYWVPVGAEDEVRMLIETITEKRNLIPSQVRCIKTGKFYNIESL